MCSHSTVPKEICILYTDTLQNNRSVLLTVKTDKESNSTEDISGHLATYCTNNDITSTESEDSDFVELRKQIDDKHVKKELRETPDKLRKYSTREWLGFVSVCLVMMTIISIMYALSTLFPYILTEFGESRASTATIQSVFIGVGSGSGLVVGSVVQQYGPYKCGVIGSVLFSLGFVSSFFATSVVFLVISCGVISGLGYSFLVISGNHFASLCFEGTAKVIGLSVVSSAIGVGAMAYSYLLTWIVEVFGLRGCLLVLGGITMNGIPMALLWKPPVERNQTESQQHAVKEMHANLLNQLLARFCGTIKQVPFFTSLLGFGLAVPSIVVFEVLIIDILESNGLNRKQSVILLIVLNATSIPGRLVPGIIKRINGAPCLTGPIMAVLISGIGMVLMNVTDTLSGSGTACAAIGLAKGILLSSVQIVVLKMLGNLKFSIGLGLMFGLFGVFITALGPLNGFLRDISGSYTASLYGASVTISFALLLLCISMLLNSRAKHKKRRKSVVSVFAVTRF